jgi:hypothetical protein
VWLLVAGDAFAKPVCVASTLGTKLGFGKVPISTSNAVVTVNSSLGGDHLDTLRVAPGAPIDLSLIPVTDPESTATVASWRIDALEPLGGVFGPISGGGPLTQNVLPLAGVARVCLIFAGCGSSLSLNLTANSGATGLGVGGTINASSGGIRISLFGAPWQLTPATLIASTASGMTITVMHEGFIHAPGSGTSTTVKPSGVIQLITPTQISTDGLSGNQSNIPVFTSLTLHFRGVPEPRMLQLLLVGIATLCVLGVRRMRH